MMWVMVVHHPLIVTTRFITSHQGDAATALSLFTEYGSWIWKNEPIMKFIEWCRHHNSITDSKIQIYGLEVIDILLDLLGNSVPKSFSESSRDETGSKFQFLKVLYRVLDDDAHIDRLFSELRSGGSKAWNARERMMMACLQELMDHLSTHPSPSPSPSSPSPSASSSSQTTSTSPASENTNQPSPSQPSTSPRSLSPSPSSPSQTPSLSPINEKKHKTSAHAKPDISSPMPVPSIAPHRVKMVVWAHSAHAGDGRGGDQGRAGKVSLGQLIKQEYGDGKAFLIGTLSCIST